MVGIYDDFAYDGTEFNTFLAQDQFASGSSPEDFHVHSATEPHFPSSVHALKGQPHHPHQPSYFSPTDPLGPTDLDNALQTAHLARSAPTSFPITPAGANHPPNLTIDTMGLAWNATSAATATPTTVTTNLNTIPQTDDPTHLRALLTALQSELRQTARERDEARMQLSTARNELYAARQLGKRLRVERDEARSQAEFLGQERVKLKQTETRLRRERNEARLAVLMKSGGGGKGATAGVLGVKGGGVGGMGVGAMGLGGGMHQGESQGEESGGSPEVMVGMDQG